MAPQPDDEHIGGKALEVAGHVSGVPEPICEVRTLFRALADCVERAVGTPALDPPAVKGKQIEHGPRLAAAPVQQPSGAPRTEPGDAWHTRTVKGGRVVYQSRVILEPRLGWEPLARPTPALDHPGVPHLPPDMAVTHLERRECRRDCRQEIPFAPGWQSDRNAYRRHRYHQPRSRQRAHTVPSATHDNCLAPSVPAAYCPIWHGSGTGVIGPAPRFELAAVRSLRSEFAVGNYPSTSGDPAHLGSYGVVAVSLTEDQ